MSILITNIQRFSIHDGPGIRTTVFLKGCSLRCPWCSNPENQLTFPQQYKKNELLATFGKYYKTEELITECLKDRAFYEGKLPPELWNIKRADQIELLPGGVTFSGGECLLQMKELAPVCDNIHENAVHIVAETSLFVPTDFIHLAIEHIDLFYCDIKILNSEGAEKVLHGDLRVFLNNLDLVMSAEKPVIVRVPVIGTYTETPNNRLSVRRLLNEYKEKILKIELLKEHNLGESKYMSLGMDMNYHGVSNDLMELYKEELSDLGVPIEVCKI